ncbi:MAG: hypothetical protein NXH84_08150 [Rhodobacteraceae bacterium]|nr:hypothetical protein [Paracoccaceae bacterium]
MSAPNTNVEKQKDQHKPALVGIRGAMLFGAVLMLGLVTWLAYNGQEPRTPDTRIDGRTGQEVPTE